MVHQLNARDILDDTIEATFWGVFNNKGVNHLGKTLVSIRNALKTPDVLYDTWIKNTFDLTTSSNLIPTIQIEILDMKTKEIERLKLDEKAFYIIGTH